MSVAVDTAPDIDLRVRLLVRYHTWDERPTYRHFDQLLPDLRSLFVVSSAIQQGRHYDTLLDRAQLRDARTFDDEVRVERATYTSPFELLLSFPSAAAAVLTSMIGAAYSLLKLYERLQGVRVTKATADYQVELLKVMRDELKLYEEDDGYGLSKQFQQDLVEAVRASREIQELVVDFTDDNSGA